MRKYSLKSERPKTPSAADLARDLNHQQRAVVTADSGPMLVIAGAGSGKTHTLTYRVAHLVSSGTDPRRILLLTFTNKAARAMTERVASLLGDELQGLWSGTFHSIANRMLRQDAQLLGYPRDYTIIDAEDCATLMKTCAADVRPGSAKRLPKPKVLARLHSMSVNTQRPIDEIVHERYPYFARELADIQAIISLYGHRKADMALMDFDDLLLHLKRLLVEHPDVRARWADTFEHVLVDEYQDTNHLQGQLVDLLAAGHGNVMVVGDDCQSIYAFRGADYHNILEFPERYPGCQRFRLEINYRSTPQILELANQSIARNTKQFEKTLRAERPKGPQPALVEVRDVFQQAEFVCQRILELVDEGISMREIAVLYRAHHHSMELQVEMTKRNIPFTVRSGMRFFEQAHIKDVLSYLRLMYNPRDELAFMRLAHHWRGIGARRAQDIWTYVHAQTDPLTALCDDALARALPGRAKSSWQDAATVFATLRAQRLTASPADMIDTVMHGGYIEVAQRTFDNADHRLGDLEQLTNYAAQYDELDRFLGEISLLSGLSSRDIAVGEGAPDELVTLTSIHQAKGLEWSACFVLWLSDGHFPSERATREVDGLEEERRLFYVASTRAKDDLYLCHPYTQYVRGQGTAILRPSPFILELEDHDDAGHEPWERWTIDAS